jgi:arylsulfatase A-like enzyme
MKAKRRRCLGESKQIKIKTISMRFYKPLLVLLPLVLGSTLLLRAAEKPNVVFILTDDQGYGDLAAHGNPILKTPKLDALHAESLRFTDFHVAPMCTPTRGELMTGISAFRNGATAVCEGRSLPRAELPMMAQFFKDSGYRTGHFGKWHLGDNHPFRPHDRGFDESVHNGAWGIKSLAEYWDNDAYDDIYWRNNHMEQFEGYNTDAFFREAMEWIDEVEGEPSTGSGQGKPFFAFIPTTAAHVPFIVPEKWSKPYEHLGSPGKEFYGMVANIDHNIAKLDAYLEKKGLKENTILIFMTDNGTVMGGRAAPNSLALTHGTQGEKAKPVTFFNAGMRGKKTSEYDGGHRVPFFLRWPEGGYNKGRDINALTHSTDVLPTLIELCGLKTNRKNEAFDGHSLVPLIIGKEEALDARKIVVQYRAIFKKWSGAVLWKKWRLVNGQELYNVASDPGQTDNIYDKHPDVVRTMRNHYEQWVSRTEPIMEQTNYVTVGTPKEPVTWLSACNWTGSYADNWKNLASVNEDKFGNWNLHMKTTGDYEISLYMFHPKINNPLNQSFNGYTEVPARPVAKARLIVDGKMRTQTIQPGATHATFSVLFTKGKKPVLEGQFLDADGNPLSGSFFTFVRQLGAALKVPTVQEHLTAINNQSAEQVSINLTKPNVVLIFIDDMGYGDIGPFGNTVNQTPNLDRMAKEGNMITQFYVSNTACTPSRSALMTGTYATRIGMDGVVCFPNEKRGLNPSEHTIGDMMKSVGYRTGIFGKWHLGDQKEFFPLQNGFDEYFGIPYSNDMWPFNRNGHRHTKETYTPLPVLRQNDVVAYVSDGADQSLLCEVITDEAIKFIKKNKDNPFFLYLPHAYVHLPRYARLDLANKADRNVDRAAVEEVDTSVGRILDTLRELNLDENTLVIFTSDNGPARGMTAGPLRGNKGGPKYEGHMREPTITWWPGTIPAGTTTGAITASIDILPSLAKLVGADLPTDRIIDGKDSLDTLLGKSNAQSPHEILYYEIDAIRRGDWKLVRGAKGKFELYNLKADLAETNNLIEKRSGVAKDLKALLDAHAAELAANTRPPGMLDHSDFIISEPGDTPRLRDYLGLKDFEALERTN